MTKGRGIAMNRLSEGLLRSILLTKLKSVSAMFLSMMIGGGLLVIAQASNSARAQPASLSLVEFNTLHKELMQGLWWSIPWKTSIREGRELAVKEKKPIVYWAVQGHVLSLC